MSIAKTFRNFASGLIEGNTRPVDLHFGRAQRAVGHLLALHHADIHEGLMSGIDGQLTCVSTHDHLSPALFLGLPVSVRLLVVGAPTHAFSLSRPSTRADAVRQGADPAKAGTGLREWLGDVLPRHQRGAPVVAVFDTRASKVRRLPAAAGPRAARLARRRGMNVVVRPEAYLVADVHGPLLDGEMARAHAWGGFLATLVRRPEVRPSA